MSRDQLFIAIVDRGRADKLLQALRPMGLGAGLIIYGEGTAQGPVLKFLGFDRTAKELILMTVPAELSEVVHNYMERDWKVHKKNRGICFSLPLSRFTNLSRQSELTVSGNFSHHLIITILDQGGRHDCLEIARRHSAPGATVIPGRGAGIPQHELFDLVIEPQKDIVLILSETSRALPLADALISELGLNKPSSGLLFLLPVDRVSGLMAGSPEEVAHE